MYAQKIEGDQWVGEKMDPGKIDKMSGKLSRLIFLTTTTLPLMILNRSAAGTAI